MKIEIENLETQKAWIVGSKAKEETVFFHQIIYKLSHRQRLWQMFNETQTDFYFMEIDLPFTLKPDYIPF